MASKPDRIKMTRGWDIEPSIMLPGQMQRPRQLTGEQKMLWRMMEYLVADLERTEKRAYKGRHHKTRPSLRDEALHYIYATDRCWPYSFELVCQHLDIDADAFRSAIEKGQAA